MTSMPRPRAAASIVPARRHGRLQPRNVIAERCAEAAGFEKVALHIDDDERRRIGIDGKRRGFGFDRNAWHPELLPRSVEQPCKIGASGKYTRFARPLAPQNA